MAKKKREVAAPETSKWHNKIVGHEEMEVDKLLPHPKNWRKHPKKQAGLLSGAIEDIGYIKSVVYNQRTGRILDGHLRVELAKADGIATIPVEIVDLSPEEEAKALLTLDPIAGLATPDDEMLTALGADFKIEPIVSVDLRDFLVEMTNQSLFDEDTMEEGDVPSGKEAEGLEKKWGTAPGQVWKLGEHVLVCGNSAEVLGNVLGERKVDLVVTSPPYNVGVDYGEHEDKTLPWPEYKKLLSAVVEPCVAAMKNGRAFVWNIGSSAVCHPFEQVHMLTNEFELQLVRQMIWYKHRVTTPQSAAKKTRAFHPLRVYESVFVLSKGELEKGGPIDHDPLCEYDIFTLHPKESEDKMPRIDHRKRSESTNLETPMAHPAAFPVRLPAMFVRDLTDPGETVLDPFGGSGTTMMACQKLGRKTVSVELSPEFVAVAIERWNRETGQQPVLEASTAKKRGRK